MSTVPQTATEVFESMTGYEEVAITEAFGVNPNDYDAEGNSRLVGTLLGRALVFIHARREGKSDVEAKDMALSLTMPALLDYFASEDEESGKEQPSDEPESVSTPPSA